MPVLVGNVHDEVLTLRDASGIPVSGATLSTSYAARQDAVPFTPTWMAESPVGSGTYPLAFTPVAAVAYHLWITALRAPDFVANYRQTIWPVSAATPIEHVVGVPQEEMLVLLDSAGTPIAGAAFAIVAGSVVAPSGDAFAPTVVASATRTGVYFARWTPQVAGYRRCELATTNTTPVQRFILEYEANPAGPPLPQPVSDRAGTVSWADAVPAGTLGWTQEV